MCGQHKKTEKRRGKNVLGEIRQNAQNPVAVRFCKERIFK